MLSSHSAQLAKDLDYFKYFIQENSEPTSSASSENLYHQQLFQDGKKIYRCLHPNCDKIFRFKSEISRHLLTHLPERPLMCQIEGCKKSFKRQDALRNHTKIHSQDHQFECSLPLCNRKFITKSALKYHILKHKDQKLFGCSFVGCHKSFITKSQLKQHEKAINYHQNFVNLDSQDNMNPRKCLKAEYLSHSSPQSFSLNSNLDYVNDRKQSNNEETCYSFESVLDQTIKEDDCLKGKLDAYTNLLDRFFNTR